MNKWWKKIHISTVTYSPETQARREGNKHQNACSTLPIQELQVNQNKTATLSDVCVSEIWKMTYIGREIFSEWGNFQTLQPAEIKTNCNWLAGWTLGHCPICSQTTRNWPQFGGIPTWSWCWISLDGIPSTFAVGTSTFWRVGRSRKGFLLLCSLNSLTGQHRLKQAGVSNSDSSDNCSKHKLGFISWNLVTVPNLGLWPPS